MNQLCTAANYKPMRKEKSVGYIARRREAKAAEKAAKAAEKIKEGDGDMEIISEHHDEDDDHSGDPLTLSTLSGVD